MLEIYHGKIKHLQATVVAPHVKTPVETCVSYIRVLVQGSDCSNSDLASCLHIMRGNQWWLKVLGPFTRILNLVRVPDWLQSYSALTFVSIIGGELADERSLLFSLEFYFLVDQNIMWKAELQRKTKFLILPVHSLNSYNS